MLNKDFDIEQYDNDFILLKSKNDFDLRMLGKAIFERKFVFVDDVIVTEKEICLKLNKFYQNEYISLIQQTKPSISLKSKQFKLPVFFSDHEDWDNVIQQC